jgi:hypothetical protein
VTNWLKDKAAGACETALMLILDVRTRWASTHQMLRTFLILIVIHADVDDIGRALDYRQVIDTYVAGNRELVRYKLTTHDWEGIALVAEWLKQFRHATTEMSTTEIPMLSSTHATFRGLQKHIKAILSRLPDNTAPEIKKGLLDAHRKLSDYYYKFDQSPLYIWAACMLQRH